MQKKGCAAYPKYKRRYNSVLQLLRGLFRSTPDQSRKLWTRKDEFDFAWKTRIDRMAHYINGPGPVADIGCGMMWLEAHLKSENLYIPIDYVRRDERTRILDLNSDQIGLLDARFAVLSGVVEYVRDVHGLARQLGDSGVDRVILSYCTVESHPVRRMREGLNWINHYALSELLDFFISSGFVLAGIDSISRNTILVFDKRCMP
jgi:hypothetical protein